MRENERQKNYLPQKSYAHLNLNHIFFSLHIILDENLTEKKKKKKSLCFTVRRIPWPGIYLIPKAFIINIL